LLKIMTLADGVHSSLDNGRGKKIKLVDERLGTSTIDLHHNTLEPGGQPGRYHRHTKSDNIYIVMGGTGELIADGKSHNVHKGEIIFIPAGMPHSLNNPGNEPFEIFEIYAPAGADFDFTPVEM
jgi:mannose-6-phosphate isomerase-like protein (cupin superfamily)